MVIVPPRGSRGSGAGRSLPKKRPKPEDGQGMLEFGKEVVLSSSSRLLFAKLLFTCLGKGKRFFCLFL